MNPRTKSLYERWRKRVALWQRSGLTAAEFAANADLDPEMLRHWKAILDQDASVMSMPPRAQAPQAPTPLSLVELRPGLSITDERCEIDLGDLWVGDYHHGPRVGVEPLGRQGPVEHHGRVAPPALQVLKFPDAFIAAARGRPSPRSVRRAVAAFFQCFSCSMRRR